MTLNPPKSARKVSFLGLECEIEPIAIDDQIDVSHFKFEYICENVPGPAKGDELESDERFYQIDGCCCSRGTSCSSESNCPCIMRFGPAYVPSGLLANIDPFENYMQPVFECNSECLCSELCSNRVVQNGVKVKLKVFLTQKKGFGVKAVEPIPKQAFVCEYVGEILTPKEAEQRTSILLPTDTNFIMTVKEHLACGQEVTYIDPTYKGNAGRFINHSCDPNLFLVPVRVDDCYPRVAMFALRDIEADEELNYDYSGVLSYNKSLALDVKSSLDLNLNSPCYCDSLNCRKYLPLDPDLCFPS